jgi:YceI-like domain
MRTIENRDFYTFQSNQIFKSPVRNDYRCCLISNFRLKLNPMNKIISALLLLTCTLTNAQQKRYEVVNGNIDFTSNAPLELINASSEKVKGVIDFKTKQFAFIVSNGSFKGFNSELQRQHFNEKYMESDKYYESTFTGVLQDSVNLNVDGNYKVRAKGTLVIHGKKQPRTIPAVITVSKGQATVESEFKVLLADHEIEIPKVVNQKIATEIIVKLKFALQPKEKN